jgi:soluble P-type ATPase
MILIQRPGQDALEIEFLFIAFEGTLASDGRVHPKAKDKINLLSKRARIYIAVKTGRERADEVLRKVKAEIVYLTEGESARRKAELLHQIGPARTAVIGNGVDDAQIVEEAALGICVIGREGAWGEAIKKADVVVCNILDALDFLLKPLRQKATLGK